jgi:multimeric flavodoxin WrbA
MRIVAFLGSPNPKGSTARLLGAFAEAATAAGHEVTTTRVYDLNLSGCKGCGFCKSQSEVCCIEDDFTKICLPAVESADMLVLASPIYFGQITGPLKTLLDRFYPFFSYDMQSRRLGGKKFATITVSGAPAARFTDVTEYLKYWLGEFFKMKFVGSVIAGDLPSVDRLDAQPDLIKQATKLGAGLA